MSFMAISRGGCGASGEYVDRADADRDAVADNGSCLGSLVLRFGANVPKAV